MNAKIKEAEIKKLTLVAEANGLDPEAEDFSIDVTIDSNAESINEDLRMLEAATCGLFRKVLPYIDETRRKDFIYQFIKEQTDMLLDDLPNVPNLDDVKDAETILDFTADNESN